MPNFVCRFCALEQPDGKLLVVQRLPRDGEIGKHAVKLTASRPVATPPTPLTEAEFWSWVKKSGDKGFQPAPWEAVVRLSASGAQHPDWPFDGPAIEEVEDPVETADKLAREVQQAIASMPNNSIRSWLSWQDDEGGNLGVAIEITNHSSHSLPRVKISWLHAGIGQADSLFYPISPITPSRSGVAWEVDLAAGQTRRMMADSQVLDCMRRAVESALPEHYRLVVLASEGRPLQPGEDIFCYGRKPIGIDVAVGTIPGEMIAEFLSVPEANARSRSTTFTPPPEEAATFSGFEEMKRADPTLTCFAIVVSNQGEWEQRTFDTMQRVNSSAFAGRAAGTVLYLGPTSNSGERYGRLLFLHKTGGFHGHPTGDFSQLEAIMFKPRSDHD